MAKKANGTDNKNQNAYKAARLKAAKSNPIFKCGYSAAAELNIPRERFLQIEQSDPRKKQCDPTPYDVKRMAEAYNAPELCSYYCSQRCPLGGSQKPLSCNSLGEVATCLLISLKSLESETKSLYSILSDCKISEEETVAFQRIAKTLADISNNADSMLLWAKKNGLIEK